MPELVAAGARFPDVTLPLLEGNRLALRGGGPGLVVIGHADCGATRLALPVVDRIHAGRGDGARVAIVLQEDASAARELVGELGLRAPVALEPEPYPLSSALGVAAVPTAILVDPDGRVARVVEGYVRDDLAGLARDLGMTAPLFAADDPGPALRPG